MCIYNNKSLIIFLVPHPPPSLSLSFSCYRSDSIEVCTISEECFTIPPSYHRLSRGRHAMADEEEELLQLAIRQSLMQGGTGEEEGGRRDERVSESTGEREQEVCL